MVAHPSQYRDAIRQTRHRIGLHARFHAGAGALAAPLVLGGPKSLWFTPIVYDRFYQAFNWNQGSAYALILLLTCIAFVLLVMRLFKVSFSEIAR